MNKLSFVVVCKQQPLTNAALIGGSTTGLRFMLACQFTYTIWMKKTFSTNNY